MAHMCGSGYVVFGDLAYAFLVDIARNDFCTEGDGCQNRCLCGGIAAFHVCRWVCFSKPETLGFS